MRAQSPQAALGSWGWSARAWVTWASIRWLQNSAALMLPGLPGRKDWQVSSVRMKSDGAGESWYQENQPICVRWRDSKSRLLYAFPFRPGTTFSDARYPSLSRTDTR